MMAGWIERMIESWMDRMNEPQTEQLMDEWMDGTNELQREQWMDGWNK